MAVTLHSLICDASGTLCEDAWGQVGDANHGAAWILDGATGLGDKNYIAASDAAWYAGALSDALASHSLQAVSVQDVFHTALADVARQWHGVVGDQDLPRYVLPSAAGVYLRWQNNRLEYVSVGDCRGWMKPTGGELQSLTAITDDPNDAWVAELVKEQQALGLVDYKDIWRALLAPIRAARASMNQPGGYQIFSVQPEMARDLTVQSCALRPGVILLCSDGLFRLVDIYQRYTSESLMTAACANGLSALLGELRDVENDDAARTKFPRLKGKDDTTALLLRVA